MSFKSLGYFVFRHRRAVIYVWCALLVVGAVVGPMAMNALAPGSNHTTSGEAADGYRILEQEFGIRPTVLSIVFTSDSLRADSTQFMDEMDQALAGLQDIEKIDSPITYRSTGDPRFISADGHVSYAVIGVDGDLSEGTMLVSDIREGLQPQPHLTTYVTGEAALWYDVEQSVMTDWEKAEIYTFPLVAIILILVFGSLVAAGLPLAIGAASVALSMALVFIMVQFTPISTSSMIVIVFIGLAISIDYALIMVTRFRQELRAGKGIEESLATTVDTSGKAIFYAAFTSMIGFGALISYNMSAFRSLGIGGVSVLIMALAAGLTLVPAILSVVGPRINRLAIFRPSQREGKFWYRLARWEMRHPAIVLLIVIPLIGLLSWPVLSLNIQNTAASDVTESSEARQGFEVLSEGFGAGELAPVQIAVTTRSTILDTDKVAALYDFTREVEEHKEVSRIESIVNLDPAITNEQYQFMYADPDSIQDPQIKGILSQLTTDQATMVQVYTKSDPLSPEAEELVTYIRELEPEGLTTYVTGCTALHLDSMDQAYSYFPWVLLIIGSTTFLALLWLFKSILLPIKAIVLNIASVAAAYGIVVFIFQQGHFSGVLGFTATGGIEPTIPIMAFCVIFGLSIDYEVFLLSRMREAWVKTGNNTQSVGIGLARTGRVITGAAAIMVVVFGSLVIGDVLFLKIIGVTLALAIFIDAAIIRIFMAPSLMRIMGKWNWWAPAFMTKLWTPRGAVGIPKLAPGYAKEFALRMKGVSQSYRIGDGEVRALKNVTLDVIRGEFIVIVGPDGSGKTTLLNLVGGIESPTSGSIKANGIMATKLNKEHSTAYRRNIIGFVFQCFNLVPTLTVRGNVEFAITLVKRPRNALKVLKLLGLQEHADHYPNKLSGSEQQRLAIAVALAKDSPILLCDEPTVKLDFETGKRILSILRKINHKYNKTMLIATNNDVIGEMADRVIRLESGEIVEDKHKPSPIDPHELVW